MGRVGARGDGRLTLVGSIVACTLPVHAGWLAGLGGTVAGRSVAPDRSKCGEPSFVVVLISLPRDQNAQTMSQVPRAQSDDVRPRVIH